MIAVPWVVSGLSPRCRDGLTREASRELCGCSRPLVAASSIPEVGCNCRPLYGSQRALRSGNRPPNVNVQAEYIQRCGLPSDATSGLTRASSAAPAHCGGCLAPPEAQGGEKLPGTSGTRKPSRHGETQQWKLKPTIGKSSVSQKCMDVPCFLGPDNGGIFDLL